MTVKVFPPAFRGRSAAFWIPDISGILTMISLAGRRPKTVRFNSIVTYSNRVGVSVIGLGLDRLGLVRFNSIETSELEGHQEANARIL